MNNQNKLLLLIGVIIIFSGGATVFYKVRGLRNNNAGNIELGDSWLGRVSDDKQTDDRFVQFVSPEYGIRAIAKILDSYKRRGVLSIRQILSTYAPSFENNVDAYVNSVTSSTGFSQNHIPIKGAGDYLPLIKAIIKHENGFNPYSDRLINDGIALS